MLLARGLRRGPGPDPGRVGGAGGAGVARAVGGPGGTGSSLADLDPGQPDGGGGTGEASEAHGRTGHRRKSALRTGGGPAFPPHRAKNDVLRTGRGLGPVPGSAIRIGLRVGHLRQRRVHLPPVGP